MSSGQSVSSSALHSVRLANTTDCGTDASNMHAFTDAQEPKKANSTLPLRTKRLLRAGHVLGPKVTVENPPMSPGQYNPW